MKKTLIIVLTVCMLFAFASCSKKQAAGETTSTAKGSTTAVQKKDTITFAVAGNPYRFFHLTAKGCGGDDNIVLANVYDNLLCLENDGSLSMSLAESYTVSDDGKIYTFNLRKGVKFSNGVEMTSEDVKWSLDKGNAGPLGGALLINYESCEIVDKYTVKIHLTDAYAAFPYAVASRVAGIACKSYWDQVGDDGYMEKPIGTGPYKLMAYAANDYITLEANPDHWRGCPPTKTIEIKLVADPNTIVLGLQNGDYDVMAKPSIDMVDRFAKDPAIETSVVDSTARVTLFLNGWSGIGTDVNFRKAIQYAIDKDEINIAINNGLATILTVDLCPVYSGYPQSGLHTVTIDIAKAKDFLKKSNYKGESFTILCQAGTDYERAAKVIQAQLLEIGINCEVGAVDNTTLTSKSDARDYDAYLVENLTSIPDADAISSSFKPTRYPEPTWYPRTLEIYELSRKGCSCPADQRDQYYIAICNILTDDAYNVPLYNGITSVAYNSGLTGVGAHCLSYYLFRYWQWK